MSTNANPDRPRYLIPKPTRRTYEVMPGWGLVEFGLIGAGAAAGACLAGIGALIGLPIPILGVAFILPAAAGGALAFPPPTGEPLYREVLAARDYLRRPKRYVYDWTRGDD